MAKDKNPKKTYSVLKVNEKSVVVQDSIADQVEAETKAYELSKENGGTYVVCVGYTS